MNGFHGFHGFHDGEVGSMGEFASAMWPKTRSPKHEMLPPESATPASGPASPASAKRAREVNVVPENDRLPSTKRLRPLLPMLAPSITIYPLSAHLGAVHSSSMSKKSDEPADPVSPPQLVDAVKASLSPHTPTAFDTSTSSPHSTGAVLAKQKDRQIRNRESALRSRQRQRDQLEHLATTTRILTQDNELLRSRVKALEGRVVELETEKEEWLRMLDSLVDSHARVGGLNDAMMPTPESTAQDTSSPDPYQVTRGLFDTSFTLAPHSGDAESVFESMETTTTRIQPYDWSRMWAAVDAETSWQQDDSSPLSSWSPSYTSRARGSDSRSPVWANDNVYGADMWSPSAWMMASPTSHCRLDSTAHVVSPPTTQLSLSLIVMLLCSVALIAVPLPILLRMRDGYQGHVAPQPSSSTVPAAMLESKVDIEQLHVGLGVASFDPKNALQHNRPRRRLAANAAAPSKRT